MFTELVFVEHKFIVDDGEGEDNTMLAG
jgi:hypothetical protein